MYFKEEVNTLINAGLAAAIGALSGILLAISFSRLDPTEAVKTGI